ncbi:hypothetical protein [Sphingomonas nostoxanthinifaciens]|uniref:hypothetical protein n=1 Tax=Sphingomonas nostoxanthinifaciens TaxID=2872652 RepID=UPI001CC214D9|nr:hypothetical protein [Sphingomonas nostoxanthinifaciens]UAK23667.1 hypothetical protein K8P63_14945 [Sphingomonas nostoxanthinifaciens]
MSPERVAGLSATQTLFESMGDKAKDEMGVLLTEIAIEGLAQQQSRTPIDQGNLQAGLSAYVDVENLRARMGLLDMKAGRSRPFYGRPVDRGIRAQTVTVQRRRRVNGKLRTQSRGSRKRASDIIATYTLNIKARPGTYFIEAPDLGAIADGKIDAFWADLSEGAIT